MMDGRTYTPQQMEQADRLTMAMAKIPEDKRDAFARAIEAMMLGAEIATRAQRPTA